MAIQLPHTVVYIACYFWNLLKDGFAFLYTTLLDLVKGIWLILYRGHIASFLHYLRAGISFLYSKYVMSPRHKPDPEVEHFFTERTVKVRAIDGSQVVAHKREVIVNDQLIHALQSVSQYAPGDRTDNPVNEWSRQYGNVGDSDD